MAQVEIQHRDLTDPQLHEPKGISTATDGQVYRADGEGSGNWIKLPPSDLDFEQAEFDNTTLEPDVAARALTDALSGTLTNSVADASTFAQVNKNCKEITAQVLNADEMIAVLKTNVAELNRVVQAIKNQLDALTFTAETE
jgi:hypothetical protein